MFDWRFDWRKPAEFKPAERRVQARRVQARRVDIAKQHLRTEDPHRPLFFVTTTTCKSDWSRPARALAKRMENSFIGRIVQNGTCGPVRNVRSPITRQPEVLHLLQGQLIHIAVGQVTPRSRCHPEMRSWSLQHEAGRTWRAFSEHNVLRTLAFQNTSPSIAQPV